MDDVEAMWARLASRAIRVALTRKELSYPELATALTNLGLNESARSVEGKVQRGTFKFTFFLQTLTAARVELPDAWLAARDSRATWDEQASAVLKHQLARNPWMHATSLALRLADIGVHVSDSGLLTQIEQGSFSAAFYLQCATVCNFLGLERFLDSDDLRTAALTGLEWSSDSAPQNPGSTISR